MQRVKMDKRNDNHNPAYVFDNETFWSYKLTLLNMKVLGYQISPNCGDRWPMQSSLSIKAWSWS